MKLRELIDLIDCDVMRVRNVRRVLKPDDEVAIYDVNAKRDEDHPLYFGSLYVPEAVEFFDRQIVHISVGEFVGGGHWGFHIVLLILPE